MIYFPVSRIKKISALIAKQCVLDDAMNWLSTLGGAYSALGDQLTHHVSISTAQYFCYLIKIYMLSFVFCFQFCYQDILLLNLLLFQFPYVEKILHLKCLSQKDSSSEMDA